MTARSWRWLALAVGAVAAMVVVAASISDLGPVVARAWLPGQRAHARAELFGLLPLWWGLFAVAVWALRHCPVRPALVVAVLGGLALAVASLAAKAVLSDDLYRYAWDGRVQANGVDPYRYPPSDPHLARLHDRWLWPDPRGCAERAAPPGCTRINRATARSIYPPLAQLWFRVAHTVLPAGTRDRGYELLGMAVAAGVAAVLLLALVRTGRDPRLVALWTLSPVVALEAVQNAHVDVLAALFVAVAAAVALTRPAMAMVALTAAALTKLYPLVLVPALVQQRRRLLWPLALLGFGLAYLPYALDVGSHAAGYLRGYLTEEGYQNGDRFELLTGVGLPAPAAKALALTVVVVVLVLAVGRRLGPPVPAAQAVFVTVLFVATPGEPWYELVLVVLVALTGSWQWLGVVVADYLGYLSFAVGAPRYLPPTWTCYLLALLAGVGVSVLRRERGPGPARRWSPVSGREGAAG